MDADEYWNLYASRWELAELCQQRNEVAQCDAMCGALASGDTKAPELISLMTNQL